MDFAAGYVVKIGLLLGLSLSSSFSSCAGVRSSQFYSPSLALGPPSGGLAEDLRRLVITEAGSGVEREKRARRRR